jgi:hypothetical protein
MRTRFRTAISTIVLLQLFACNNATDKGTTPPPADSVVADTISSLDVDYPQSEYETMYAVIADTGFSYAPLQQQMYALSNSLKLQIDTMNRTYSKEKDKIVLSENDEDEMYRGEYYPRRTESGTLSLEYYIIYSQQTNDKNIALMAGLFYSNKSADSLLALIKPQAPAAFVLKASVYAGCLH